MCDNNCKCKSQPQPWDVLSRLLGGYIEDSMRIDERNLKVFLNNGDIADVVVFSNKEINEEYIASVIPDFKSFVPTTAEIMLKAEVRYSRKQVRILKDLYYSLAYMMEADNTEDWDMLVKLFATAYSVLTMKALKQDFPNLPENLYKDIKRMLKEIKDCYKNNNFWEEIYKVAPKKELPAIKDKLPKHGCALGVCSANRDAFEDTQNRCKKTKNYYNVRDSKGRFTKKVSKRVQKRNRLGRFC